MTDPQPRAIRDVLAEMMRRERLGHLEVPWAEFASYNPEACEQWRIRGDNLLRLLASEGLSVVRIGQPAAPSPTSDVVWRYYLHGRQVERIVKRQDDGWQIVDIADGKETVGLTFTIAEAHVNAGLVLTDDPAARTIAGLGRQLAALTEIYRITAAAAGRQA